MKTHENNINERPRIAVTGLGLITALGRNVKESWENICAGKHGISNITAWDNSAYAIKIAAQIKFDLKEIIKTFKYNGNDRCHQLALIAAYEALQDAYANLSDIHGKRVAVVVGTSLAGMVSMQEYDTKVANAQKGNIAALHNQPMHVCADVLANEFNFTGTRSVISTACTASTIAIAQAATLIRSNQADVVLVCGCDPLSYFSFSGFSSMKNVSATPCSPFSENVGLSLGEAAGVIILEKLSHAEIRKAKIYSELEDYALSCDAYHPTSPDPTSRSQIKLINQISKRSQVAIEQINYINMHGTGTNGNDSTESLGIEAAFSKETDNLHVSSIKGSLGHTLGAAGAIEAILTIKAIETGVLPPTANFISPRKNCNLNYVPNEAIKKTINYALTQNFAFGGNNAALLFSAYEHSKEEKKLGPAKRVVITGIGMITPLGDSTEKILENINANLPGVKIYKATEGTSYHCGMLPQFNPAQYVPFNLRRADRFCQMIVSAASLALKDAKVTINKTNTERTGIIMGTVNGHASTNLQFHRDIALKGPDKVNPIIFPNTVLNAGVGLAAIHLQLKGCSIALSMGQVSGALALSHAFDLIKDDAADMIIAGGADEINDYILDCYAKTGVIRNAKNNSLNDKMNLGEGAAFVVMESYESAIKRNAKIYCEVLGYSSNGFSYKNSDKNSRIHSIKSCISASLSNSNIKSDDINTILTSGIKYKNYLLHEEDAIKSIFQNPADKLNFHEKIGTSAITDIVGLNLSIGKNTLQNICLNSASIGGTTISMIFSNVMD